MHDNDDIVVRVSSTSGGNSIGALANYLASSCGHVAVDMRVSSQGYRFYPEMSDEIPAFFNRRCTTGTTNIAITLQYGVDLAGNDPFAACTSNKEAQAVISGPDYEPSMWLVRLTVGTRTLDVHEVADPLFIAKHPSEFRLIAEELIALGVMQSATCPLCSDAAHGTHDDAPDVDEHFHLDDDHLDDVA